MNQLLARVRTWCGVTVKDANGAPATVLIRDKPIARFLDEHTLEAVLCGSIKRQVMEDPDAIQEGSKCRNDSSSMVVDLNSCAGVEEGIRLLLNAYITSQSSVSQDWWLQEENLNEDPTCEKLEEVRKQQAK